MDVGIRELKERLSELLERASRGEVIRVTDRGRPKAILAPIPGRSMLEEGVAAKWIRAGREDAPAPVQRQKSPRTVIGVLREDRER